MSERDRQVLIIGGAIAGLILLYLLVFRPLGNAVHDLDTRVIDRQTALNNVRRSADELRMLRATLPKGAENVNLLSYLEGLARQAELKSNIEYMKPGSGVQRGAVKRQSVELKLVRVNHKQLTKLLLQVERGGRFPLKIDEIHIKKRFDAPDLLDVTIEVYQG
jgi:type II secretory pathway component PulM